MKPNTGMRAGPLAWLLAMLCIFSQVLSAQERISLHDAVERALASPAVRVADAKVGEQRGTLRQAGLRPNPKLYLQSEDIQPWADGFSFPNSTEDYIYAGQTIETAGKRGRRVDVARAKLRQAEAERDASVRGVIGSVVSAYWNAEGLERVAGLLANDLRAMDEMVDYHRKRVDAGATKGVDLIRTQIERDRLLVTLRGAEREAAQARIELAKALGQPSAQLILTDKLEDAPVLPPMDEATALASRPDVIAAREAVTAARADVRLQKASRYPDFDLFAGYKRNMKDNTAYAALQVPLPLFNRNQGEIERSRAAAQGAEASLAVLEAQVRAELNQANVNYKAQQQIVNEVLPDMRARARQNLDIMSEAYRIGGVDLLRYLDAVRTEIDVEVSAIRTTAEFRRAAAQLQLAYGVRP